MSLSLEMLYLRLTDQQRAIDDLTLRFEVIERFVKEKNPQHFAPDFAGDMGELGSDPALKPIPIIYGEPQQPFDKEIENGRTE